ncbi:hypothetical protein [Niveispirillum sp. BGYR6]|uniref:protein-tyrosine phosphatase family protein n=1 Tax=Niveispirillum sp. BGYR6 TaxID=2971249 RepID=UPI0022B9949C|nr:hypothetical protein [Niveispirillum sp. BGYR6]MDG5496957.1 hypothetical protein [Niveispirillum sp. BGYR6]
MHIHGGSCLHPQIGDAAIYIGFDNGMKLTPPAYPWHGQRREVLFRIPDQGVPPDLAEFGRLLDWTADQLRQGGLIHAGCIGGHGRTGMFLAALVRQMTGNADAAQYVRDHYCCKAIESERQVAFLAQHFNIRPVIPHRPRRKRAEAAPGA